MTEQPSPYIQFNKVSKSFFDTSQGEHKIFDQFSTSIQQHEFVSILGPSGCGKSTLLRLVSGLIPCSEGQITIDNTPVTGAYPDVAFVFQKPTLLPWLNAEENILFPLKHKNGSTTPQEREQARHLLKLIDLEQHATKLPDQLSGGMQQRIAIARALIQESHILLMDEPFSALDALNREKLGFELLDLLQPKPKTVLFITHSIAEAVLLSDRIIVLDSAPARIVDSIPISLGNERDITTLNDPAFGRYCDTIRKHFYRETTGATNG